MSTAQAALNPWLLTHILLPFIQSRAHCCPLLARMKHHTGEQRCPLYADNASQFGKKLSCKQVWPKRFSIRHFTYITLFFSGHCSNFWTEHSKWKLILNDHVYNINTNKKSTLCTSMLQLHVPSRCHFNNMSQSVQQMAVFTKEFHMQMNGHTVLMIGKDWHFLHKGHSISSCVCALPAPGHQMINIPQYVRSFRLQ